MNIKACFKSFRTRALTMMAGLYGALLVTPDTIRDPLVTLLSVDVVDYSIMLIQKWGALIALIIGWKGANDSLSKPPLDKR